MITEPPYYTVSDFIDLKLIDGGGGGTISIGKLEDFGQIVVKQFRWSRNYPLEKYRKEIEILIKYRHPNIVQVFGILGDGCDKSIYLGYVMEYIEGGSLDDVIHDQTRIYDLSQICLWIEQIGCGLQFLHKNGIIHRDIKPENILVAGEKLKLADFGIARNIGGDLTAGVGTYRYLSPEAMTTENYGPAADIYSLAITIWEIFHRKRPYSELGDDWLANLQAIKNGSRPGIMPDKMDTDLSKFIQRCWHINASDRPSIKEIVACFVSKLRNHPTILICEGHTARAVLTRDRDKWIDIRMVLSDLNKMRAVLCLNYELYVIFNEKNVKKLDNNYKWVSLMDMSVARYCIKNSCLEWNGSILVLGGYDRKDKICLKSVERYDPEKDKWIGMPDMNHPRRNAAATAWNGKVIVCGGKNNDNELFKSVECYDSDGGVWIELANMPAPFNSPTLRPYRGNLILSGARCSDAWRDYHVLEMNPLEKNGRWKEVPPQTVGVSGLGTIDDNFYVISNFLSAAPSAQFPPYLLIFDGQNWQRGPTLPCKIFFLFSVIIPQHLADHICKNYTQSNKCCIS